MSKDIDPEILAELIHGWYLEATKNISEKFFNPEAQKDYKDLKEEQRSIDKYVASKVVNYIKEIDK